MPILEEYAYTAKKVPFVLKKNLFRTPQAYTKVSNWHDDIEIEYFKSGVGTVLLDGKEYPVAAGDFIFVQSNRIHQLIPKSEITYSCLIVNRVFCETIGFSQKITPRFQNAEFRELFLEMEGLYNDLDAPLATLKAHENLLRQLLLISVQHSFEIEEEAVCENLATKRTKAAILYIRKNFSAKLTLEKIASELFISKFLLSREFKEITHTTVIEYLNAYRCKVAAERIRNGASVAEAAFSCGYENMSYFTKTFKKHFNYLPSKLTNRK